MPAHIKRVRVSGLVFHLLPKAQRASLVERGAVSSGVEIHTRQGVEIGRPAIFICLRDGLMRG